jgi:hypothetical protein
VVNFSRIAVERRRWTIPPGVLSMGLTAPHLGRHELVERPASLAAVGCSPVP